MKLWIARDKSGFLYLHEEKPTLDEEEYWLSNGFCTILDLEYFPEVTFENGPKQIKMELL